MNHHAVSLRQLSVMFIPVMSTLLEKKYRYEPILLPFSSLSLSLLLLSSPSHPLPFHFPLLSFPPFLHRPFLPLSKPARGSGRALYALPGGPRAEHRPRTRARACDTLSPITRLMAVNLFTDKAVVRKVTVWFQSG